jgi:hypothetical protein
LRRNGELGRNHTHIGTNYHDENNKWRTSSIQSHCFKVGKFIWSNLKFWFLKFRTFIVHLLCQMESILQRIVKRTHIIN